MMDQQEGLQNTSQRDEASHSPAPASGSVVVHVGEREDEIADSNGGSMLSNKAEEEESQEESGGNKVEEESCVIVDVKEFVGDGNNQRVCRICHLNAKETGSSMELVELGCGCKGELGVAHLDCAEAWFRVKGNRMCEICGKTANNITGVRDNGFLDEWNESRPTELGARSLDAQRTCLGRQPLCNFLMACLVVAFVLPWFFRVNMF